MSQATPFHATTADPRLTSLIVEQNARMAIAQGLPTVHGPVVVTAVPSFDRFAVDPSPQVRDMVRRRYSKEPGKYDPVGDAVFLNEPLFFALDEVERRAVVAHEVAHAMRYRAKLYLRDEAEEIRVDILACRMGFASEILESRRRRSPDHALALTGWEDEGATIAAVRRWNFDKRGGFAQ
jgi:hypothetical protein